MSEPRSEAGSVRQIVPGLLGWHLHDDRIDARSDAYALVAPPSIVLVDPLPLSERALRSLDRLGRVRAVCLTGSCHQRSAWRYRARYAVPVHAPAGSVGLEQEPDFLYGAGEGLPGGLTAIHAPGPARSHYALYSPMRGGVLFCADVLVHLARGGLRFVQGEYQEDPGLTRKSARAFLQLSFRTICTAHGAAIATAAKRAVRDALEREAKR